MDVVGRAAVLVVFPVVAAAVGSYTAALRRPGPKMTSGVQHFAAGVVFAAVAAEVLPDLKAQGHLWAVAAGFCVGVAVLLTLGAYSRRMEQATKTQPAAAAPRMPVGLLVAVRIDLLLDGLLVGLGVTLGSNQGIILTRTIAVPVSETLPLSRNALNWRGAPSSRTPRRW